MKRALQRANSDTNADLTSKGTDSPAPNKSPRVEGGSHRVGGGLAPSSLKRGATTGDIDRSGKVSADMRCFPGSSSFVFLFFFLLLPLALSFFFYPVLSARTDNILPALAGT